MKNSVIIKQFKENYDDVSFLIVITSGVLSLLFSAIKLNTVASTIFKLSFIFILIWFLIHSIGDIIYKFKEKPKKHVIKLPVLFKSLLKNRMKFYLFCFIIVGLISILLSSKCNISSPTFFNQFIVVTSCLVLFYLLSSVKIKDKIINSALIIILVLSYMIIISFFIGLTRTWYGTISWTNLNLNFNNPNFAGEFLVIMVLLLTGIILYNNTFVIKLLSAIALPILFFLLNLTSSRNPILSVFLSIPILILFIKFRKSTSTLITFVIVLPIMYLFFIMLFGYISNHNDLLKELLEKYEIYGRYRIWAEEFKKYSSNPIFGSYYLVGETGIVSGFLNAYVMVLISFGPFALLFFILIHREFILRIIENINFLTDSKVVFYPLLCFLITFYLILNEGGIYVGGGGLYIIGIYCSVIFSKYSSKGYSSMN